MSSHSPLPWPHSRDIHIITLIPATLSFFATAIGSYWFFGLLNVERNFRRTLVLVLILADCSKSFWIMVFNIVGLATGDNIHPRSPFCQIGGFFVQFSFEACDLAVLFLVTHVAWQILPPTCLRRSQDGLWRVRYWVLAACLLIPIVTATIPFHRFPSHPAYNYDGVYCSLVTGPVWLALILSWAPRYVIWLYMLGLLTRLYFYIRSQSQVGRRRSRTSASSISAKKWSIAPNNGSVYEDKPEIRTFGDLEVGTSAMNHSQASRGTPQDIPSPKLSITSFMGTDSQRPTSRMRAVFFYPLFYILAWSVPFVAQCISFSSSRGINGLYALRCAAISCVASLGLIDVVIFCLNEKPWRHGWNFRKSQPPSQRPSITQGVESNRQGSWQDQVPGLQTPPSVRRPFGGGSDQNRRHVLQAYERLALEQVDGMARPKAKRSRPSQDLAICCPVMAELSPTTESDQY